VLDVKVHFAVDKLVFYAIIFGFLCLFCSQIISLARQHQIREIKRPNLS